MTRTSNTPDLRVRVALRSRAVARLTGPSARPRARGDASDALRVLYELASCPTTASAALALLHELQVHQVEVDLQEEELRRSRVELETSLYRQMQLYDHAPVGYFTLDRAAVLREINVTGATLLACERDALRGRSIDSFLTPDSVETLHGIFGRVSGGSPAESADLQLHTQSGTVRRVHASASPDPAGAGFLLALLEVAGGGKGASP